MWGMKGWDNNRPEHLYVPPYMLYMLLAVFCFTGGRRIRIVLLLYYMISVYDIMTSREVRVIQTCIQSCSSTLMSGNLLPLSTFGNTLIIIPSLWENRSGWFSPSFHLPFLLQTACENFLFPLDVKERMFFFLCLVCLLGVVYTMFRVKKEISRKSIQRFALSVGRFEWHRIWEKMEFSGGRFSLTIVWNHWTATGP